ncbi:MAG: hypothetical protein ACOCW0_01130 [Halanaerobium sp.]
MNHDLKEALDIILPYKDENGNLIHYRHHETWQNAALVECDNRNRSRDIIFQVMGE